MTRRGITIGVDGSLGSTRALDRAAEEASSRATVLEIVYAVSDLDEAGPVLASAVARVRARHPGLCVLTLPVRGRAATVLAARGRHAELTVVGCRGLGGIAGLLLGSVSRRLAALTSGPLLVVRGNRETHPYSEVLIVPAGDGGALGQVHGRPLTDGPARASAQDPTGPEGRAVQPRRRGPSASGAVSAGRPE
ncbi:universal stress protein [Streptomyces sp. YC504]|uniref:Universal stress protein n=1 Tax=Streptomyces mesophilus TaxID=1775132 RepID=A0A6G4XPW4_9ACTN|nr:universal stress protein [Streptomyces mesophilus]NGO78857.1 universal stress protein [Streptomyces mesophilus]